MTVTATRVFPEWRNKSIEDALGECRDMVDTVQRWRDEGGKVAGHFQVYFPEEIIHASGMLPFKVRGAPMEPNLADSHFGSYLCSILKTSLEMALSDQIPMEMFVSHPICDAARNLAAIWGRNTDYPSQILYLPQNPNSSGSVDYLIHEYDRIRRVTEEVSGTEITDEALSRSIVVFNENRRLMRELYDIKAKTPWLIAAEDGYALVALAGMMPREEHNEMMATLLPMIRERNTKPEDRIRVVFEGGFCEQPPFDLIRMLGRTCYVVDDDLMIGLRYLTEDVPETGDPLRQLAVSYIERSSYSPVQHDLRKPKEDMLIERLRNSNADAAILAAAKMCEPGLEEQVTYTHALDEEGIAYFVSEFEENMSSFSQLEMQVETFVENLLFA
jgi:benzoyl-CoA reductase subunit C